MSPRADAVLRVWCEVLGTPDVDPTRSLIELGGTSISAEQIASRISDLFGVRISGTEVLRCRNLEGLVRRLAQLTGFEPA